MGLWTWRGTVSLLGMIGCLAWFAMEGMALGVIEGDLATHEQDHAEDEGIETLPTVHVHGLRLNKDQQRGPVPQQMPWPILPDSLEGQELDDWMKVRLLVDKHGEATLVVLEPAQHRELTLAALSALKQWTFLPQINEDGPIDGELTVRIHFRSP